MLILARLMKMLINLDVIEKLLSTTTDVDPIDNLKLVEGEGTLMNIAFTSRKL